VDDNCDGTINENAKDTQEPNDSQATRTQLNGGSYLNNASVIKNVTIHNSADTDWLYWTTNDTRGAPSHFSITMTTTNLSQNETISATISYCDPTNFNTNNSLCNIFNGSYTFALSATTNTLADTNSARITSSVPDQKHWYLQISTSTWSTNYCNPITVTITELNP
jgi:hypothetical protein